MKYLVNENNTNDNVSKKRDSESNKNNASVPFHYDINDSDEEFIVKNEDSVEYNYK